MLAPLIFSLLISSAHAQNMDGLGPSNNSGIDPQILQVLQEDDTDAQTYKVGKFTCNEFAMRFYMQRSSRSNGDYDYEGFEKDKGVPFQTLDAQVKLPIMYVSLAQKDKGFYHAINAVLVNHERPDLVESYIFIEPQSDAIMKTVEDVYNHYKMYYSTSSEPLEMRISDLTKFAFNGNIYQSFNDSKLELKIGSNGQKIPDVLPAPPCDQSLNIMPASAQPLLDVVLPQS